MKTHYNAQSYLQEDDIQFFDLILLIIKKWRIWVTLTLIGVMLGYAYVQTATPIYQSWMTFLTPGSRGSGSSGYANLLGISTPGNIDDQLMSITKSKRIKIKITDKIYKHNPDFFSEYVHKYAKRNPNKKPTIQTLSGALMFDKNFNVNKEKNGPFSITYNNKDPKLAYAVIEAYLESLLEIYEDLEISPERDIVKVLDYPQISNFTIYPRRNFSLALGGSVGMMVGLLITVVQYQIQNYKKKRTAYNKINQNSI